MSPSSTKFPWWCMWIAALPMLPVYFLVGTVTLVYRAARQGWIDANNLYEEELS